VGFTFSGFDDELLPDELRGLMPPPHPHAVFIIGMTAKMNAIAAAKIRSLFIGYLLYNIS